MVSIDARVGAIKRDPSELLDPDRIMELCREHGYWPEADGALGGIWRVDVFGQRVELRPVLEVALIEGIGHRVRGEGSAGVRDAAGR